MLGRAAKKLVEVPLPVSSQYAWSNLSCRTYRVVHDHVVLLQRLHDRQQWPRHKEVGVKVEAAVPRHQRHACGVRGSSAVRKPPELRRKVRQVSLHGLQVNEVDLEVWRR